MRFKYKKMIITASSSAMFLGMLIFSTKSPLDTKASNGVVQNGGSTVKVEGNASISIVGDGSAVSSSGIVSGGGTDVGSADNARGISILMKNAYPEVNKLVTEYLNAKVAVDKDKIAMLVDNVTYAGIEELTLMMKNVESIKLVDCYTIDGPEDKAMMAYARTETKIKGIDTAASGVDGFYIRPDVNGELKIVLAPIVNEIQKIIDEDTKRDDVAALLSDVNTKFAHEIKSDKKLAQFFDRLKNRKAGSDENIDISEIKDTDKDDKDKKSDKSTSSKKKKKKKVKKEN
ncbi:MAG: hypothetical protein ACTTG8_07415 [Catonella sp.]|uniref:hypothetical protein n=1 Tax=Catonella sp. TaxID=2382125 RepID=UPI003FA161B5